MPATSPAQERLMQAAAHTPGGYGGVPQTVGKEFTKSDAMPIDPKAGAAGRAAGILFLTNEGETLLLRRGGGGDFPYTWGLPGGHLEKGETTEEAARRETLEETGLDYKGALTSIHDDGQFETFVAKGVSKFEVTICDESTGFAWTTPDCAPTPLHPGLAVSMRVASAKTEFDIGELMRDGHLPSPQPYANMHLLAIRITGTGLAYRSSIGEHVWRDPSLYLNNDFLRRCQGLQVIMDHPDGAVLNSKEFNKRSIGSIMLPYIQGDEVWGIAKIYDDEALADIIEEGNSPEGISTSPSVVFDESSGNTVLKTESGEPLLIEGVPFLLDHIAIVTKKHGSKGVWDKGGDPAGVLLTNQEVSDMTEKTQDPKADAQGDISTAILAALNSVVTSVSSLTARMDSMEDKMPAKELVTAADKKRKDDDDAKKDAEYDGIESEKKMDDDAKKDDDDAKKDDDDAKKDDDMKFKKDAKRKDFAGTEGKHEKSGEVKPDDDDEAKKDDDDAKKADAEESEYADAQAKADSVLAGFGKSASRPMQGENLLSYRKRLLRGLQSYSDSYKSIDLKNIKDAALLAIAEKTIFADAVAAAKAPQAYADGQLIEINSTDRSGRTITKFRGDMSAWLNDFKVPSLRATAFNTQNVKR